MSIKIIIWVLIFFMLVTGVMALNPHAPQTSGAGTLTIETPKEFYFPRGMMSELHFHVFNSTGYNVSGASTACVIHVYNITGQHLIDSPVSVDADDPYDYEVVLGTNITDTSNVYPFIIYCKGANEAGFISDFFEVSWSAPKENSVGGFPLAVIILLPLIFGILLLVGSFMFGEDHAALKIALFLIAYLTIFISLWFGTQTVIRYYGFTDLQESMSTTVWIVGVLFFVILSYFLIYAFIQGIEAAAQKKQKEMEY